MPPIGGDGYSGITENNGERRFILRENESNGLQFTFGPPFSVKDSAHRLITSQSRIIGAVRGANFQFWGRTLPVFCPYTPRKYDKRFGTPAIV